MDQEIQFTKKDFETVMGLDLRDKASLIDKNETVFFIPTTFEFIKKHKGLRPGCIHVFLGQTGHGKTTLVRSLMNQHIDAGVNCGIYLSEETEDQLITQLSYNKDIDDDKYAKHCFVLDESLLLGTQKDKADDWQLMVTSVKQFVTKNNVQVLFIDNLTTSEFYDNKIKSANALLTSLRDMARELQIALVMILHSNADVFNQQIRIDPQQVRGSKSSVNKAEYLYTFIRKEIVTPDDTMQGTSDFTQVFSFVEVHKSRAHDKDNGAVYQLDYDSAAKNYVKDKAINFEVYKELVLGKKKK